MGVVGGGGGGGGGGYMCCLVGNASVIRVHVREPTCGYVSISPSTTRWNSLVAWVSMDLATDLCTGSLMIFMADVVPMHGLVTM